MVQSFPQIGRMRYGTGSSRQRHTARRAGCTYDGVVFALLARMSGGIPITWKSLPAIEASSASYS